MFVVKNLSSPQEGRFKLRNMQRQKEELQILAKLGERKIKSLKTSYELTESELLLIIKLHYKYAHGKKTDAFKTFNIF